MLPSPDGQEKETFFLAVYYVCFLDWLLISMFPKGTLFGEAQQSAKMLESIITWNKRRKDSTLLFVYFKTSTSNEGKISW